MFRARPKYIRPTEVSAKVPNHRPITHHDPGNKSRGRPSHSRHAAHDQSARAGKQASRPHNHSRTTADASVRAGKERPTSGRETIGQFLSARPRRPTMKHPATTVPTRPRPDCPADRPDRPNAAVDPKPFLKPNPHNSSPKPAPT
ncbi:unnamed protein product [Microthlaspi erraticum]|uniref:Uncharacterized protein n=1 Tax=Microthlaspi erraticum TaxID=1685480 RepID=A0A6D2JRX6_9BRAS|nr:unnamed protein product [Microthlaspi erraticum]